MLIVVVMKTNIKAGCLLKRFGERATFVSARTDDMGRRVFRCTRRSDGYTTDDWADSYVHAFSCPCRVKS